MLAQTTNPLEVHRLQREGRPVEVIDVRTPAEYAEVHIAGAKLVPLNLLDPRAIASSHRASDAPVYFVCKSGSRAAKAVDAMRSAGFTNVASIEGGTAAWERAGLPVERGTKVLSLERQVRIGAGMLVVLSVSLGWLIHPAFFALTLFVGAGLTFAGVTDWCGMGLLLAKMPWNQHGGCEGGSCSR